MTNEKLDYSEIQDAAGVANLYSTVQIDGNPIRKAFVTIVFPPDDFCLNGVQYGAPKVIVSEKQMSQEEIDRTLDDMAQQNTRWLLEHPSAPGVVALCVAPGKPPRVLSEEETLEYQEYLMNE